MFYSKAIILSFIIAGTVAQAKSLFYDNFNSYNDVGSLKKVYTNYKGSSNPRFTATKGINGTKALYLVRNGDAIKIKLPLNLRKERNIEISADILFPEKSKSSLSFMLGDKKLHYNSYGCEMRLSTTGNTTLSPGNWHHVSWRIERSKQNNFFYSISITNNKGKNNKGKRKSFKISNNQALTFFRIGLNGNNFPVYIDNLSIRCGSEKKVTNKSAILQPGAILKWLGKRGIKAPICLRQDLTGDRKRDVILANNRLVLVFDPSQGGRCIFLIDRASKVNLAAGGGMIKDLFWSEKYGDQVFKDSSYKVKTKSDKKNVWAQFSIKGQCGIYQYLTITRKITLAANSNVIDVKIAYHNNPDSVGKMKIYPWIHNEAGWGKGNNRFYIPSDAGVICLSQKNIPTQRWWKQPVRGWLALMSGKNALVTTVNYHNLHCFYTWAGSLPKPTFEWRLYPQTLGADDTFVSKYQLIACKGFDKIDGAANGTVVQISANKIDDSSQLKISAKISSNHKNLKYLLQYKYANTKSWENITAGSWDKNKFVKTFAADKKNQTYVFRIIINDSKGAELVQAETTFTNGNPKYSYVMKALKARLTPNNFAGPAMITEEYIKKLTNTFKTPHFNWSKPSANKKIKALILVPYSSQREIIELTQRFDIAYDTCLLNQGPPFLNGDYYGVNFNPHSIKTIRKLLKNKYDVMVLGGVLWNEYFPDDLQKVILSKISNGMGLVYVSPANASPTIQKVLPRVIKTKYKRALVKIAATHPIVQAFSPSLLGSQACSGKAGDGKVLLEVDGNSYLTVKTFGKGKIAVLNYPGHGSYGRVTGGGLTPVISHSRIPGANFDYNYWEYSLALVGKTIRWCANVIPSVDFSNATINDKGKVKLVINSKQDKLLTIFGNLYDKYSNPIDKFSYKAQLKSGANQIEIPITMSLVAGVNRLRLRMADSDNKIFDFATAMVNYQIGVDIEQIKLDQRNIYGNSVTGNFIIKNKVPASATANIKLFDSFNRLCDVQNKKISNTGTYQFKMSINGFKGECGFVEINLLNATKQKIATSKTTFNVILSADQRKWNEYRIIMCSLLGRFASRAYLHKYYYARFREMGCNFINEDRLPLNIEGAKWNGFRIMIHPLAGMAERWGNMTYWKNGYEKTRDKKFLIRKRDFSNPSFLAKQKALINKRVGQYKNDNTDWNMIDEDEYSMYNLDFNFSKTSLNEFREWLKTQYPSLKALNQEWNTNFSKWELVEPKTCYEITENKNHNYSAWADHRTFNNITVKNAWAYYKKCITQVDPHALMGQSGTRPSAAYGGNNWYLLTNTMDFLLGYSHGDQYEYQHCFSKIPIAPWAGGYRNDNASEILINAIRTGRGGIAAYMGLSMVKADLSELSSTGKALSKAAGYLASGLGQLFFKAQRSAEVAIYYSMPSIQASYITNRASIFDSNWRAYVKLCQNTCIPYQFIAARQVKAGELSTKKYKVLILPMTIALSSEEVTAIKKYVAEGGVLIADIMPGVMDGHCKLLKQSPLSELFKQKIAGINSKNKKTSIKSKWGIYYPSKVDINNSTPKWVSNGAGKAIILNGIFTENYVSYFNRRNDLKLKKRTINVERFWDKLLATAECRRSATIPGKGKYNFSFTSVEFKDGENMYIMICPEKRLNDKTIILPEEKHWYNSLTATYLGFGKKIKIKTKQTDPIILAGLTQKITDLRITTNNKVKLGGKISLKVSTVPNDGSQRHVFNVKVITPKGIVHQIYSQNITTSIAGCAQAIIPLALNDQLGAWTIKIKDTASGVSKTIKMEIVK